MSRTKIDKKIVGYSVANSASERQESQAPFNRKHDDGDSKVIRMHERLERPEVLIGSTYKVKTPVSDHAMYVTINDIVLNEGTEHAGGRGRRSRRRGTR